MRNAKQFAVALLGAASLSTVLAAQWQNAVTLARDPGVRTGGTRPGQPFSSLTPAQLEYFQDGQSRFMEIDSI